MLWFLGLLAAPPAPQKAPPPLTRAWVAQAEKGLDLSAQLCTQSNQGGLRPLADYARFYQRKKIRGRFLVEATYTRHEGRPGIYLTPSTSLVADGGCTVIHLIFDPATRRVLLANCNGVA